jgi:hypothetical protein
MTDIVETPVVETSAPVTEPVVQPVADPALEKIAQTIADKPVEDMNAKELADLKFKISEYENKVKELESKYSESEKDASEYRSKSSLLKNVEGLSEEAIAALKNKDIWSMLDGAGISEEELYTKIAEGRPQLSVEEKIRKELEKIQKADNHKKEQEQKAIEEKRKVETMKTLSDWLDTTDVTKIDPNLADAHEILRTAREEKDMAVEETLISMVQQSNITYAEAVKTLAEIIEKKVLKYSSIKALDNKISTRYKKVDTPEPSAPVETKAKEVLKTIGDKIEETSKPQATENIDRSNLSLEQVLKSIKEKEKARASNLKRL